MPDGAARFINRREALFPGFNADLHIFPAVRREQFFESSDRQEFFAIINRGATISPKRQVSNSGGWFSFAHKIAFVYAEKTAAEFSILAAANQYASRGVIHLANDSEDGRIAEMRNERAKSIRLERDIVIQHKHPGIFCCANTSVYSRRKTSPRRSGFKAYRWVVLP